DAKADDEDKREQRRATGQRRHRPVGQRDETEHRSADAAGRQPRQHRHGGERGKDGYKKIADHRSSASCFTGAGFSMNMSGCLSASDIRRTAILKYFSSISTPMNLRPRLTAATPVVPEPMKGSMIKV